MLGMTYYCPACWSSIPGEVDVCPVCGAAIKDRSADLVDKYIAALRHPEPATRLRVAWLLGQMCEQRAVAELIRVVTTRQDNDPYLIGVATQSLGLIGDAEAVPCLAELLADPQASFMARIQAAQALERIGGDQAAAALEEATHTHRESVREAARAALAGGPPPAPGCDHNDTGLGARAIHPADEPPPPVPEAHQTSSPWLNRNVVGMALASLFSDAGHEMATSILPLFLVSIGAPPAALGIIEGVADAMSSFAKLGAGWFSDRLARRKPIAVAGYALTGITTGLFALAPAWHYVVAARAAGWLGRGVRGPVRDALLVDSVAPSARGRAFGFHRAGDTLGAILGPALGLVLVSLLAGHVDQNLGYRYIFAITLIPGILATCSFAFLVRERIRSERLSGNLVQVVGSLPTRFKMFLVAVAIFGAGDFAHSLLILRASYALEPLVGTAQAGQMAVALYVLHNVLYAGMSYPIGALADRTDKRLLLAGGYCVAALMGVGWVVLTPSLWHLALLFALGGVYIAAEDALEGALAADLLPDNLRGTGYGVLATVNGLGDFASSIVVGALWQSLSPAAGFGYATVLFVAGAVLMLRLRLPDQSTPRGAPAT